MHALSHRQWFDGASPSGSRPACRLWFQTQWVAAPYILVSPQGRLLQLVFAAAKAGRLSTRCRTAQLVQTRVDTSGDERQFKWCERSSWLSRTQTCHLILKRHQGTLGWRRVWMLLWGWCFAKASRLDLDLDLDHLTDSLLVRPVSLSSEFPASTASWPVAWITRSRNTTPSAQFLYECYAFEVAANVATHRECQTSERSYVNGIVCTLH
jgi:hypothetical protein